MELTHLGPETNVALSNGSIGASSPSHLRMETNSLPEIFFIWSTKAMDEVHRLSNLKCKIY
jgi:hypothetical protein